MKNILPKHFCLIGKDIQFSHSPRIYNTLFEKYNMNCDYRLCEIYNKSQLFEFLEAFISHKRFKREGVYFDGFNVTAPYKKDVYEFFSELKYPYIICDKYSQKTEACNVVMQNNIIFIANTDVLGFLNSLYKECPEVFEEGKNHVFLLGYGGAGRSINMAFPMIKHPHTAPFFGKKYVYIEKGEWFGMALPWLKRSSLIINATGLKTETPIPRNYREHLPKKAIYYDLCYHGETEFLKQAPGKKITGMTMLKEQAAIAFNIFSNAHILENIESV